MCSSMENIATDIHSVSYTCNTAKNCTGVNCITNNSPLQSVNLTVFPCDSPPSLDLDVTLWTTVYRIHANDNTTRILDNGVAIKIEIWHFDYSMDIQVSSCTFIQQWISSNLKMQCFPNPDIRILILCMCPDSTAPPCLTGSVVNGPACTVMIAHCILPSC